MASLSVDTSVDTIQVADNYAAGTTYTAGQYVYASSTVTDDFNGVWVSARNSNTGNTPGTNPAFWTPYNNPTWITSTKTLTLAYVSTFTHDKFTGSVYAKGSSDASGALYIDQSGDGTWAAGTYVTNFSKPTGYAVTDGTALGFSEEIILPYVRIRYVYTTNRPNTTFKLFSRTANSGVKY